MASERFPITYERSGVNVELGDNLSKTLYEAAKLTWNNRHGRFGEMRELHPSFYGFRAMPLDLIPSTEGLFANMGSDGVGTKVEVAERTLDHSTLAFDLFAGVCDDAEVRGAEPIAVTTTLDVRALDDNERTRQAISQLAQGYVAAARASDTVIVNGEVAELGDRVGGFRIYDSDLNYNWGAAVLWLVHKDRVLTGHQVQPGHSLVGLAERGFRSNGLSLVRKALSERVGDDWHVQQANDSGATYGELVQAPSVIYCRLINELTGGYDINRPPAAEISGIAHITGGGLVGKLNRLLAVNNLGAVIENPQQPPEIMATVQDLGEVEDKEAYSVWNMGSGMVLATPEPAKAIELAAQRGFTAQEIGKVIKSSVICIESRGRQKPGQRLNFFPRRKTT